MSEYPVLDIRSIPSLVSSVDFHSFFAEITPFIATEIVKKYTYERQRPLGKTKVSELTSAMRDGTFEPISTIIFSVSNEHPRLVDGQHTLHAIISSNTTWVLPLIVSKREAEKMYPKIDRNRSRSLKDFVRTSGLSNDLGVSETFSLSVARGVKLILRNYSVSSATGKNFVSEDKIIRIVKEQYKEESNRLAEMVLGLEYGRKLISRIPMAILLTLYKELPSEELTKVDEFIYGCATNVNLGVGDTRRLIYNMYTMYVVGSGGGSGMKKSVGPHYEASNLLNCWKYWYENKTSQKSFSISQLNSELSKSPNLAGTSITFIVKHQ